MIILSDYPKTLRQVLPFSLQLCGTLSLLITCSYKSKFGWYSLYLTLYSFNPKVWIGSFYFLKTHAELRFLKNVVHEYKSAIITLQMNGVDESQKGYETISVKRSNESKPEKCLLFQGDLQNTLVASKCNTVLAGFSLVSLLHFIYVFVFACLPTFTAFFVFGPIFFA